MVGTRRSDKRFRLYQRSDALLEKERVACGPFGQEPFQRQKRRVVTQQGVEQVLSAVGFERTNSYLGVVGLRMPVVLIIGPIAHKQQNAGQGQALNEVVENCLGLGIDPVQILEHDQQRLNLALRRSTRLTASWVFSRRSCGSSFSHSESPDGVSSRARTAGMQVLSDSSRATNLYSHLLPNGSMIVAVMDLEI